MQRKDNPERVMVASAAVRRAWFLYREVESGRVPAHTKLGGEYLAQARQLEEMFPAAELVLSMPVERRGCGRSRR